jgi:preprotein translocase subunit SecE
VADKTVKAKQPEKNRPTDSVVSAEKPRQPEKARLAPKTAKPVEKDRDAKPKKENALARWYRESVGELRKVAWPTIQDTRRLTTIVLIVMFVMSAVLGLLNFLFSQAITLLIS